MKAAVQVPSQSHYSCGSGDNPLLGGLGGLSK